MTTGIEGATSMRAQAPLVETTPRISIAEAAFDSRRSFGK